MNRAIPSRPYPELVGVLSRFLSGLQVILGQELVGAYLIGSLAIGDFDLDSDVDFLVLVHSDLNNHDVQALQTLHEQIYAMTPYPAKHLEGSYLPIQLLHEPEQVGKKLLWYVDNGSTKLERSVHDNQWHVLWVLRECAICLVGPQPQTLIPPIPLDALRHEMRMSMDALLHYFDEATKSTTLTYFNSRFGQAFAVLTCCRLLHTFSCARVESKLEGVRWAKQQLDPRFHPLIEQSWQERKGTRFGLKVHQPADRALLSPTLEFLHYAKDSMSLV
jgi:hypothetical protein